MYEFPEYQETFLTLFFHVNTQVFLCLPLFKRFLLSSDNVTPDWEDMLGAYNVAAATDLNTGDYRLFSEQTTYTF